MRHFQTPREVQTNDIPADQPSAVWIGISLHIFPIILGCLLVQQLGMTLFNVLIIFFPIGFITTGICVWLGNKKPAVELPPMKLKVFLRAFLWDILGKGFGVGLAILGVGYFLLSAISPYSTTTAHWYKIVIAILMADLWYYSIHRWFMHSKGRAWIITKLRKEHAIHHSITDLDFFRGNKGSVIDNGVVSFALPLAIFSTILGLNFAATLMVYQILMLVQVTHHVNHSFQIGKLRYIVFDSHAHKMHHCNRGRLVNFAAVFSIWDRLFGTYYEDFSKCPSYMHAHRIKLSIKSLK